MKIKQMEVLGSTGVLDSIFHGVLGKSVIDSR